MLNERRVHMIEFMVIISLWTLVVVSPLLFMDDYNQNWRAVHVMWVESSVVAFAFLVNRFLLMPHLFFAKRYVSYVCAIIGLLLFLALFVHLFDGVNIILRLLNSGGHMGAMITQHSIGDGMPPLHDMPIQRPPHDLGGMRGAAPYGVATPPSAAIIPPSINLIILSMIAMALDIGLSIATKWIISEQRQAQSDKERVLAQLSNLQSQVSPHFFMNTLNNIHALVDIDSHRAKQTIIELSTLMDYLLYESSSKHRVPLQRELEFIGNYISLMRLRFPDQVRIDFSYNDDLPQAKIPPLLFLNFIENAFKYGVDYELKSFIKIRFQVTESSINMTTLNSNHSQSVKRVRHGLGISNAQKRLNLIYGDSYTLEINDKSKIYHVNLKIPII